MSTKWDIYKTSNNNESNLPQKTETGKWDQYKIKPSESEKEHPGMELIRTVAQVPKGAAQLSQFGMITSGLGMLGAGEAMSELDELEERLPRLRKLFPFAGLPEKIDREEYIKAVQSAQESFPTVENISKWIEQTTGMPLEAKTPFQNLVALMSGGAKLKPGAMTQKIFAGLKTGAASSTLQSLGIPEPISDIMGLMYGLFQKTDGFKLPPQEKLVEEGMPSGVPPDNLGGTQPPTQPPSEPGKPLFGSMVPEHEILEKLQPMLEGELARKIKETVEKQPISILKMPSPKAPPIVNEFDLERSIGTKISKTRIPNLSTASKSIRQEINELSSKQYSLVNELYEASKKANEGIGSIHPEMVRELENLVEEISLAAEPSSVQKDIKKIAQKYISLGGSEAGYLEIPNDRLIAQIQSNNQKIQHDYLQGRPSNEYIRLNKILGDAISRTGEANPEAIRLYNKARGEYRKWAQDFGNEEILPWRDPANVAHAKNLKKIENPDQLAFIEEILSRSKKGKVLYDSIKRDYIEKQFRKYIQDPKKISSLEFNDLMREISPITTPEERSSIEFELENARAPFEEYERYSKKYNEALVAHKNLMKEQKEIVKAFPYKLDSAILRDMTSVRGMKRLEASLPKTPEGKKMLDEIKDYAAVNLLSQGKIVPSDKAESLRKILNDVNKRSLLEHTLGKSITDDLSNIVNNVQKIDLQLDKMKMNFKMAKIIGKLVPGMRGYVASGESLYDIWRMFRPAATEGSYDLIDRNVIKEIIENRKDLVQ